MVERFKLPHTPFNYWKKREDVFKFETMAPITIRDMFKIFRQNGRRTPEQAFQEESVFPNAILKAITDAKIKYSKAGDWNQTWNCLEGQRVAIDFALASFRKDPLAKTDALLLLESHLTTSDILDLTIQETPDQQAMPKNPVQEINKAVNDINEITNGEDVLVIILGNRGMRMGLAISQVLIDKFNLKDSVVRDVRDSKTPVIDPETPSKNRPMDVNPQIDSMHEVDLLKEDSEGRQIIVIGTADRIVSGTNYLMASKIFDQEKANRIIAVSIPLQGYDSKKEIDNDHVSVFLPRQKVPLYS